ncbi:MAG TPA: nitroreductase [Dehalococcoidia bacterium]|nr:nitroreductase [Dehalococcoidia bacterium]
MDVLEAIVNRRSLGKMRKDAPPRELVEQVLAAAVHAPNHHNTQPWRFFVLSGKAREDLGAELAESLRLRMTDLEPAKLDGFMVAERAKPMRSPVLIVVGVTPERDDPMTVREDLQAASAAIQNMLLAANSLGLAAIWRTGDGAYDDHVKAYFGLRSQDEIAGIVYLGYPDTSLPPLPTREREVAPKTEWRWS